MCYRNLEKFIAVINQSRKVSMQISKTELTISNVLLVVDKLIVEQVSSANNTQH